MDRVHRRSRYQPGTPSDVENLDSVTHHFILEGYSAIELGDVSWLRPGVA